MMKRLLIALCVTSCVALQAAPKLLTPKSTWDTIAPINGKCPKDSYGIFSGPVSDIALAYSQTQAAPAPTFCVKNGYVYMGNVGA